MLALELTAAGSKGRGLVGRQCPWCRHQPRSGAARLRGTAVFQRFLWGASTSGPLMSALWTPGCRRDRLCGGHGGGAGLPYPGVCLTFPVLVLAPAQVPEGRVQRRLRPESCPESVWSTRGGIHWSGVVRTARRPHLPGVHPTLLQWSPPLVQYRSGATRAAEISGASPGQPWPAQRSGSAEPATRR